MKINSSTDIFYQDTCGNPTFHLQGSTRGSQGHWIESRLQEGGRGRSPYSVLAANRKVNEIGAGRARREPRDVTITVRRRHGIHAACQLV